jgi:hypothetical protein
MVLVRDELGDPSVGERIDAPLLLLGLIYREVSRTMEAEPDGSTSVPSYLANSPLGVQHLEELGNLINGLTISTS